MIATFQPGLRSYIRMIWISYLTNIQNASNTYSKMSPSSRTIKLSKSERYMVRESYIAISILRGAICFKKILFSWKI